MMAMILAAGRGERLRPLTDDTPKALVEVNGVSLIEYHLQMLADGGVTTVVINLGWLGEMIVERIGSGSRFGLQVVYSPEYDNVLETGGGIVRALPLLGCAPFWVINADIFTNWQVRDCALNDGELARLVLVNTPPHKAQGDFGIEDGLVRNVAAPGYTFSGIACYSPHFFAGAADGRFPLAPMLREAADRGQLAADLFTGVWHDVGTPARLEQLNQSIRSGGQR
jgi:MurNAc alpha-1-phosphate uridylyltransferase